MDGAYKCHWNLKMWEIPRSVSEMSLLAAGLIGGDPKLLRTMICKVCGEVDRNPDGTKRHDVFYPGTRHLVCKACKAAAYAAKKEAKNEVD